MARAWFRAAPTPYAVLGGVIVFAALLTWLLPAGRYDTIRYDRVQGLFVVSGRDGDSALPAEQATLDRLAVRIRLEHFLAGGVRKPVSIPGTYRSVESKPQGVIDILKAPIQGAYEAVDVLVFVLVIGGFIGVVGRTGALTAGIRSLAQKLYGREAWLIVIITVLCSLGAMSYGLGEETLALFPLLVPVFLAAGYDAMVPLGVLFLGSSVGIMGCATNPFAVIIASDAAGVSWTTGLVERLLMWMVVTGVTVAYILRHASRTRRSPAENHHDQSADALQTAPPPKPAALRLRDQLVLSLFALTFVVLIVGVSCLGWWFAEMTALFLAASLLTAVVSGMRESVFSDALVAGAKDLLGVAVIIALARGVGVVLDKGEISGTILYYCSAAVASTPGPLFAVALFFVYAVLAFFVPSSSGLAVLTMPILGGLADAAGVSRHEVVNAYLYGLGWMSLIMPTGLVLPSLALTGVSYGAWLRFVTPLLVILLVIAVAFLGIGTLLGR